MNNFAFYSPTEFVFGKGTESQTAELVKKYKGTKVMIVYGGGSVVRSGLLDKVKKYLDEAGIAHVELEFRRVLFQKLCVLFNRYRRRKSST